MELLELSADQRRQLIDAKQAFAAWRASALEFQHSYRGTMHWRKVAGREYLSRKYANVWEQVGPRSAETEHIKNSYTEQRLELRSRLGKLKKNLDGMKRINRAMDLGRVPDVAASVLRKLDDEGLLGKHLVVVGTHALYAYEARTGVLLGGGLTATKDIDFLWDARQRFTFLMQGFVDRGVVALLQEVDGSFRKLRSYNAANADPYAVDFIRPERKTEAYKPSPLMTRAADDIEPAPIRGLEWLVNSPKFEETVIANDGLPLRIVTIDPRAFALHKWWLSKLPERGAATKRDALQALTAAKLAQNYMGLRFEKSELTSLPKELLAGVRELLKS
jgi:hypothetical protein